MIGQEFRPAGDDRRDEAVQIKDPFVRPRNVGIVANRIQRHRVRQVFEKRTGLFGGEHHMLVTDPTGVLGGDQSDLQQDPAQPPRMQSVFPGGRMNRVAQSAFQLTSENNFASPDGKRFDDVTPEDVPHRIVGGIVGFVGEPFVKAPVDASRSPFPTTGDGGVPADIKEALDAVFTLAGDIEAGSITLPQLRCVEAQQPDPGTMNRDDANDLAELHRGIERQAVEPVVGIRFDPLSFQPIGDIGLERR